MIVRNQTILFFILGCALIGSLCTLFAAEIVMPVAMISEIEHSPSMEREFPGFYAVRDSVRLSRIDSVVVPEVTVGAVVVDQFAGSWEEGDKAIFRVEAPDGFMFRITPHPLASDNSIQLYVSFWSLGPGGPPIESELNVKFENLQGFAPTRNDSLGDTYGDVDGRNISFGFTWEITEPSAFTAVEASFITGGHGALTRSSANTRFDLVVAAGKRGPMSDQRLFELVPIPEPSCAVLALSSLASLFLLRGKHKLA